MLHVKVMPCNAHRKPNQAVLLINFSAPHSFVSSFILRGRPRPAGSRIVRVSASTQGPVARNTSNGHAGTGGNHGGKGVGGGGHNGRNSNSDGSFPFRPNGKLLCTAFLSYMSLLVGLGGLWDAALDGSLPRLDTQHASVSIIIPAFNEERAIADTVRHALHELRPAPCEVIVVDGGSVDRTADEARRAGARVIRSSGRGRGLQMNEGAKAARGELLLFLHADTRLPEDAVADVRASLSAPRTVLAAFRPLIRDYERTLWFSTLNNLTKTWYGPLLLRPASYVRGLRVVFGDQALCCRSADLRAVGGYRADIPFMEDAELCIAMHMAGPADKSQYQGRGRVRMLLHRPAITSGRRIAAWGELRANAIFAYVSLLWLAGASPAELHVTYKRLYGEVR